MNNNDRLGFLAKNEYRETLQLSFRLTDKTTRLEILIGNSGLAREKADLFLRSAGKVP